MSDKGNKTSPETIAAQLLHAIDKETGGVVPIINLSTTFSRDQDYNTLIKSDYQRAGHPLLWQAEGVISALEKGQSTLLFCSGMAAGTSFLETLKVGARVIAQKTMYYAMRIWLLRLAELGRIQLTLFDAAEEGALEKALKPGADLVWIETPCNPTWDVVSIAHAATLSYGAGAELIVDATVMGAVAGHPLSLGADYVLHSATKYLNGHSDVLAGAIVSAQQTPRMQELDFIRSKLGGPLPPFETWLLLRGLRTLFVRYRQSCRSALAIAQQFETHEGLQRVIYPGLASHPGHQIAVREMPGGFSGMLSLLINGGFEDAKKFCTRLKLIIPATSLGGVESLAEHRKTVEGPTSPVPDNLVRLSIGLEDADELMADIAQALG